MLTWLRIIFALAVLIGPVGPVSAAEGRLALVIGNGAYQNVPRLPNPARDAQAVAAALKRLGFQVVEGYDLTNEAMVGRLREFGRAAEGSEVAVVFYAGHGMQIGGRNYLIPINATLAREQDLTYEALSLETVLNEAQAARRIRLVILDACRDNPFTARIARSMGTRSASVGRGFARVEDTGDTLVAFATKADAVAEDGVGEHSPYTTALLQFLETPDLPIERLFGRVRDSVMANTAGRQQPFTYGSLGSEAFYFRSLTAVPSAPPAVTIAPAAVAPVPAAGPSVDRETVFWQSIQNSPNAADFEAYLSRFPDGLFAPLARNRLNQLTAVAPPPPTIATGPPVLQPEPPKLPERPAVAPGVPGRYPEASTRVLNPGELASLSCFELKVIRNEIFARYGYIFRTAEMRNYFAAENWYRPRLDQVDRLLTAIERRNVQTLQGLESSCRK